MSPRGAAGVGAKDQGWGVTESFGAGNTNEEVLRALENGTTNLVIEGDADLDALFKGVYLSWRIAEKARHWTTLTP